MLKFAIFADIVPNQGETCLPMVKFISGTISVSVPIWQRVRTHWRTIMTEAPTLTLAHSTSAMHCATSNSVKGCAQYDTKSPHGQTGRLAQMAERSPVLEINGNSILDWVAVSMLDSVRQPKRHCGLPGIFYYNGMMIKSARTE